MMIENQKNATPLPIPPKKGWFRVSFSGYQSPLRGDKPRGGENWAHPHPALPNTLEPDAANKTTQAAQPPHKIERSATPQAAALAAEEARAAARGSRLAP